MNNSSENSPYIQEQRTLYLEKNAWMDTYYERVDPHTFYRELFPVGSFERKGHYEDGKGNGIGICVDIGERASEGVVGAPGTSGNRDDVKVSAEKYILNDGLESLDEMIGKKFVIMSPVSYYGKSRVGKNARYIYAIAFDLDGVEMPQLRDTFHEMKRGMIPEATFVVNSGTGLHLYYFLESPVAMYPQFQAFLRELKYALTRRIWNNYTSTLKEPQIQSVLQGFRVVGSQTKLGRDYPVVAQQVARPVAAGEYDFGIILFHLDICSDFCPIRTVISSVWSEFCRKSRYPSKKQGRSIRTGTIGALSAAKSAGDGR